MDSSDESLGVRCGVDALCEPFSPAIPSETPQEFNIFSIFKSPMALCSSPVCASQAAETTHRSTAVARMGIFSCGLMFLLPKLQPMLDEEKAWPDYIPFWSPGWGHKGLGSTPAPREV